MITSSRRETNRLINNFNFSLNKSLLLFIASLFGAYIISFVPTYDGMNEASNWTLFILVFSALLWITEAIPAFAVSILLIGLEIVILGENGGVFATHKNDWKMFLSPWASSLMFLFIGGFILSLAASKTRLDIWIAKRVLFMAGTNPRNILLGIMSVTFVFSMFVSNTATTTMMLAVILPIIASLKQDNPFGKAILLGVAAAANIGGMGTIIGTPPNAIAIGALGDNAPSFLTWMIYAVPPSFFIITIITIILLKVYPSNQATIEGDFIQQIENSHEEQENKSTNKVIPFWHKGVVIFIFSLTVILWLTSSLHHLPTAVVAFLPIVAFTITGIIDSHDIRSLPWDILLLITGGLSLGLAVSKTGLASWFAHAIPLANMDILAVVILFAFVVIVVSNFMSHTAATNILLPIVIAIVTGITNDNIILTNAIIVVALSASNGMLLSVSTPPNAIVYSSGKIQAKDFLLLGSVTAVLGPVAIISWIFYMFS